MELLDAIPLANAQRMLHELRVHQIELEMQNEQLRQSLEELDAARARYFNFYDLAPVGYVTVNEAGLIVEANLTSTNLLGVTRETLLGQPFSRFVLKTDTDDFYLHCKQALETGEPHACELRMVRHDGTQFWARLEAVVVQEAAGGLAYNVVMSDISARKQAELALAESEDRFRLFMDNLPAAAFITGEDSAMQYANRYVEKVLGTRAWLGKTPAELFSPEFSARVVASDRRALEAGKLVTEEQVLHRDGQSRLYEVHRFRIARQGKPFLLGAVGQDITERKQAEDQLKKLTATLEDRVDKRTQQLRRISAQLTMTEERERRFLAEDLHDNLHQYLFAIKLRLGLLRPDSPQSSFDQIMEMVAQADHAARTITQQLSPPILHTLGLVPALEWLVGEKQRLFGLTVHFNHDACLKCSRPFTEEVQASLFRSVRELLVNVARHAGVSEARLSCACDNALTRLVVSDNGCGFDAAGTDGVWPVQDSFGLAHIYERIVAIDGTMDIVSSFGNGTTVTLTIPHSVITKESQPS